MTETSRAIAPRIVALVAATWVVLGAEGSGTAAASHERHKGQGSQATRPNDGDAGLTMLPLSAFQQTTAFTCGPATLLTLLRFYGRDADELEVAEEAGCTADKWTSPRQMAAWLESRGLDVTWGEHGTLGMLRPTSPASSRPSSSGSTGAAAG